MDTPMPKKTPRRKLKRVIVKNKFTQKKLKSAINVSLNSSHTVRSLRLNNRSLAHRIEELKRECRSAIDSCQSLHEENHLLRQRIVSLECVISDPDSYIKEQVKLKIEDGVKDFKAITGQLFADVQSLSLNLKCLDEICSTSLHSDKDENEGPDSLGGVFSQELPHLSPPLFISSRYQDDVNTAVPEHDDKIDDMNAGFQNVAEESSMTEESYSIREQTFHDVSDSMKEQDMSMILDQFSHPGIKTFEADDKEVKESQQQDAHASKLPKPLQTRSRGRKAAARIHVEMNSPIKDDRKLRRKTHNLSDDEVNVIGILDVEPPPSLLLSPNLPACGENREKRKISDENREKRKISDENREKRKISHENREKRNISDDPPCSEKKVKGPVIERSHKRQGKKLNSRIHKTKDVPLTTPTSKKKTGNDCLFIANEFALNNMHEQMTKMADSAAKESLPASKDFSEGYGLGMGERTVHMDEDMELTMPVIVDTIQITSQLGNNRLESGDKIAQSESNSLKQLDLDEMCPEAVTLQRTKPGQIKFAVSRKEVDGHRKSLSSHPPRARSKSKKAIAEMIENLPQEEPRSIFDFHDKTPTLTSEKDTEDKMSVYSLRDEPSLMSPPTPFRSKRAKVRHSNSQEAESNKKMNDDKSAVSLLGDGASYSVPLNDESNKSAERHSREREQRGRSRSRKKSIREASDANQEEKKSNECEVSHPFSEAVLQRVSSQEGSDEDLKISKKSERSRSRVRISQTRSRSRVKGSFYDESGTSFNKDEILNNGSKDNQPDGEILEPTNKTIVRKSRGRSRNREESFDNNKSCFGFEGNLNNEDELMRPVEKRSLLGEGITYSVPLKDESETNDKITVRKARGRSRSRIKTSHDENQAPSHDDFDNTPPKTGQSDKVSHLGEGVTYSIPLKDDSEDNEINAHTLKTSRSLGRSSRARSRSRVKNIRNEEQNGNSIENVNDGIETTKLPEKISVLGEGITYSVPLKDESETVCKIAVRKSRGRSQTRVDKDEAAYDSEVGSSCHRAKSSSRHRQNKSSGEGEDSSNLHSKSRGRSKSKVKNLSNKSASDVMSETTKSELQDSIVSDKINILEESSSDRMKMGLKSLMNATDPRKESKERSSQKEIKSFVCSDDEGRNSKSPPKSHKKVPRSNKKLKKSKAGLTVEENISSELNNRIFNQGIKHKDFQDIQSTTEAIFSVECADMVESGDVQSLSDKSEEGQQSAEGSNHTNFGDGSRGNVSKSRKQKNQHKADNDKTTCNTYEMEKLKSLYTPDGLKQMTLKNTPSSSTSATVKKALCPSQSTISSLADKYLGNKSDDSSVEPSRRRRAAAKAITYAEPSLNAKLRRGDPYTSMATEKIPVFKSPRGGKRTKIKREILGSLQNMSVTEEPDSL